MRLYSQNAEFTAIRALSNTKSPLVSGYLFSTLDTSWFHTEPCKAAFARLRSVAKQRGEILSFSELCEDPLLDEDLRDALRESEAKRCRDIDDAKRVQEILARYRKTRIAYEAAKSVIDQLQDSSVDPDKVLNQLADGLLAARAKGDRVSTLVRNIGHEANSKGVMRKILTSEAPPLYKTGFVEYDERTGGLPTEGVMLLAATTSGGKSTVLMNLLVNIFQINMVDVMNVSLEMQEHKLVTRHGAMLTGIEMSKFKNRTATEEEIAAAEAAWLRLHRFGRKHGIKYGYMCPTENLNMTQLLLTLKPLGYKVIGIDYVGLLEGMSEDDQWRKLSEAVREAKIYSSANNCLVIILAQLDDASDKLRYSKGMLEHVDTAWFWNYAKPEIRELRRLPIGIKKERDGELYNFELGEEFHIMRVVNPEEAASSDFKRDQEEATKGKKKRTDDEERVVDGRPRKKTPLDDDDISFEEGSGLT